MLYWNCKDQELTWPILLHAIKRNFGGLDGCDPVKVFREAILSSKAPDRPSALIQDIEKVVLIIISNLCVMVLFLSMQQCLLPGYTELDLIQNSLQSREISWHGYEGTYIKDIPLTLINISFFRENRYLLF